MPTRRHRHRNSLSSVYPEFCVLDPGEKHLGLEKKDLQASLTNSSLKEDCKKTRSLFVIKFSHFSLFQPSLFIQYSTEECSTVQLFIYKIIAVIIDIDMS